MRRWFATIRAMLEERAEARTYGRHIDRLAKRRMSKP